MVNLTFEYLYYSRDTFSKVGGKSLKVRMKTDMGLCTNLNFHALTTFMTFKCFHEIHKK